MADKTLPRTGPVANKLLQSNLFAGAKGGYGVKNYVRTTSPISSLPRKANQLGLQGSLLLYTGLTMVAGSVAGVLYRDGPKIRRTR